MCRNVHGHAGECIGTVQSGQAAAMQSLGKCTHMCIDMCIDMCIGMCIDMCIDMSTDMCIGMCIAMCIGMCCADCRTDCCAVALLQFYYAITNMP